MSIIQTLIGTISASSASAGGGGGGGGGGGPTYGSWTIEWWGKKLSPQTNTTSRVFACGVDTSASIGYSNEQGGDFIWLNGNLGPMSVGSIVNSWHHWCIASNGTQLFWYKDGVNLVANFRSTYLPITDSTTAFRIGSDGTSGWKGRLADFHIMKGVCKYPNGTTFTPPTRLTTVESGTVLLTACNPDLSTEPFGATSASLSNVADDPWNDGFNSFEFDGQPGSYIQYAGNAAWALDVA